jgi:hypothetical protein
VCIASGELRKALHRARTARLIHEDFRLGTPDETR